MTPSELARIVSTLMGVLGLAMISATSVFAYDDTGAAYVAGYGGNCGQLTEDLKKGELFENMYDAWLKGFVAGINLTVPGKVDYFVGTDGVSRLKFLEKYCEENPLDPIVAGLDELVKKITGKTMQHLAPQPVQKPKPEK